MKGKLFKQSNHSKSINTSKYQTIDNNNHSFTTINKHIKTETSDSSHNNNNTKYNIKTLFLKNLKVTGNAFKKTRSYSIFHTDYTLTSSSIQTKGVSRPSKNPSEEQIKKRLKKPFEYSFKNYLRTQLYK